MKISRIQKVTNYRIFRNFSWPSDLPDFARFNVIYGWNGSGKTSLSNLFQHIQRRQALTDGQVEILIDQTRVAGADFSTAALPAVRVFNRDAVDRNVFEQVNQQFPPVFFLGEDSVEKQKKIEDLKKQLETRVQDEYRSDRKKSDATSALESFCSEEAKGVKNLLTVAGGGLYNNYNAANFKADVQRLAALTPVPALLPDDLCQQHLATKDGKAMAKASEPSVNFPDFAGLTARTQALLSHSVVSSIIAELVENPSVAGWVHAGLSLHSGQPSSNNCKFCDQPLPERRIQELEAHFNDEFKKFQLNIDALFADIHSAQRFEQALRIPPKEALYDHLRPEYEKTLRTLRQQAATVKLSLEVLLRALEAKRNEPFKDFELRPFITGHSVSDEPASRVEAFFQTAMAGLAALSAAMGQATFDRLKLITDQHNQRTETFDASTKDARAALAKNEILKALPEWAKKSQAVATARDQAAIARDDAENLRREIAKLEIEVRQHRRPAEELNQEVASYLGRDELRFEVEQNGYRITRGGQPAI